jgi:hypothetical protein
MLVCFHVRLSVKSMTLLEEEVGASRGKPHADVSVVQSEPPFFLPNFALSHMPCNCKACTEARVFTFIIALILISKLCVFNNSSQ